MKQKLCLAVVMVMVAALIGCKNDGGGAPGLPGQVKKPADLPDFEGTFVDGEYEAKSLLSKVSNSFADMLTQASDQAYSDAFNAKYGDPAAFRLSKFGDTKASVDVTINDLARLKTAAGVDAATITGSSKMSASSSRPFGEIYYSMSTGDWTQNSSSIQRTFAITNGFYASSTNPVSSSYYKAAGYIKAERNNDYKLTLKEKALFVGDSDKYEENNNTEFKVSVALTVFDGTKGAKFIYSYALENNRSYRTSESSGGSTISSLEVYDNSNTLRYTIQDFSSNLANRIGNNINDDIFY